MNIRLLAATAALSSILIVAPGVGAEERMIVGEKTADHLVAEGAIDAVTFPGRIVDEVGRDASNFGVGGLITGTARGSVLAAGQALRGGARMLVGIFDVLTIPLKGEQQPE